MKSEGAKWIGLKRLNSASAVGLGAVILLLCLVSPVLAVVAIWPLLLLVPGWCLVKRLWPGISGPGQIGLGIVITVFVSTHLVDLVATLMGGFGPIEIVISAGLLGLVTWLLYSSNSKHLGPRPKISWARNQTSLVNNRMAWGLAGFSFAVVLVVMSLSDWRQVATGFVAGGWNWSDFLLHVSIATSIQHGNFPPQVPFLAGAPLTYHWFGDFQVAILSTASGIGVIPLMGFMNALMAGALALLVFELADRLLGNRRAAGIATVLAVFGGGMGYIRLPIDALTMHSNPLELLSNYSYDNGWNGSWPFFHIASVLGTGLLAQRATVYGLAGLVAVVLLVHHSLGKSKLGMLTAGGLAALSAPFQLFFFPVVYLVVAGLVMGRRFWRIPRWGVDAALFLVPVIYALPFVASLVTQHQGQGSIQLVLGWSYAPLSEGPLGVAFFYATNLGVPFLLALVASFWRGLPHRVLLVGWLAGLFILPNVLVASASAFDMNKIFQAMWIAVAILAAWLIRRWPGWLVGVVIFFSVLSPLLVSIWYLESDSLGLDNAQVSAAQWIEANTPNKAVFVTDAYVNSPVDLAGRLRIAGYGPYEASFGYDPSTREAAVNTVYCDGPAAAAKVMRTYGATYVLSSGGLLTCGGHAATDFSSSSQFRTLYSVEGVSVWQLVG